MYYIRYFKDHAIFLTFYSNFFISNNLQDILTLMCTNAVFSKLSIFIIGYIFNTFCHEYKQEIFEL